MSESPYKIQDLRAGDVVWIKFVVVEPATEGGDVLLRYLPRPGLDEYARSRINDVFIRPDRFTQLRRLFGTYFAWLRK